MRFLTILCAFLAGGLLAPDPVHAASHLWRVNEIFSDATGTLQFIELKECCGSASETFLNGKVVESITGGSSFTFPANLSGTTSNKHLLLATTGVAALAGFPPPDHIIPDNFFNLSGDTIWYAMAFNYDSFTFTSGDLPTDGVMSIQLTSFTPDTWIAAANTPTNYAGQAGSVGQPPVDPDFVRGDCNIDGGSDIADAITVLGFLFPQGAPVTLSCPDACDSNDDGNLDVADAVAALTALFGNPTVPLPAPTVCGVDPSTDTLLICSASGCP